MNILRSIILSAIVATLFVYESPLLLTEVHSEPMRLPQNAAANSGTLFSVDTFYGRGLHLRHRVREIVASPFCR
jgi:hypothetical protein